jgi:hypothetical protein
METMEQRLQALEDHVRRTRRVDRALLLALGVVVGVAGAHSTTPSDSTSTRSKPTLSSNGLSPDDRLPPDRDRLRTVEADQFVLLDRLGHPRATLMVTGQGPAICMFDERGKKRLEFGQNSDGSGLRLLDPNESPVASLEAVPDGASAHLELRGPLGKSWTKAEGLTVQDRAGRVRLQLAMLNENFPVLGISDGSQHGPPSFEVVASNNGERALKIHDKDGHALFSVFVAENGTTCLGMRHPDHERSLQISTGPKDFDGPKIGFFGPANQDGTSGILPFLQLGFSPERQPWIRIVGNDGGALFTAPPEK